MRVILIFLLVFLLNSCKYESRTEIFLKKTDNYKKAVEFLKNNTAFFTKCKDNEPCLYYLNKAYLQELVKIYPEMDSLLSLWKNKLVCEDSSSIFWDKNGAIIFLVVKEEKYEARIVCDTSHIYDNIGITDDFVVTKISDGWYLTESYLRFND